MTEHNDVKRICREEVGGWRWERNRRRRSENHQTHSIRTHEISKDAKLTNIIYGKKNLPH